MLIFYLSVCKRVQNYELFPEKPPFASIFCEKWNELPCKWPKIVPGDAKKNGFFFGIVPTNLYFCKHKPKKYVTDW